MHVSFARTTNVRKFLAAYERLLDRGAGEACWLAVSGKVGFGKTKTVQWFCVQQNGVYIRSDPNWNVKWMLEEIAKEFGLETRGSVKELSGLLLERLAETQRPLIVDEARNLLHDGRLLETLRTLTDVGEFPLILSGEDSVLRTLTTRYQQIRSRISETVEFSESSFQDCRIIYDAICGVKVADEVVAEAYRQSGGSVRLLKNTIAEVERIARLKDVGDVVEGHHVAGHRLCQDTNAKHQRASA